MSTSADDLYGLPLDEFTSGRNELERRLRRDGDREQAEAVKSLRKPTVAAWALNQLARRRRADVERLVAAGERLRGAQEALLQGGDRDALSAAAADERSLVGELARDAAALEEKLRATLHAAATDEEAASELLSGRLVRDREAVGLFGLAEAPAETARPRSRRAAKPAGRGRGAGPAAADTEEAAGEAARRTRELERALRAANAEESKARRRHAGAARTAGSARQRAEAAAERLRDAEQEEQEAAAAFEAAATEVQRLEKELGRVRGGR